MNRVPERYDRYRHDFSAFEENSRSNGSARLRDIRERGLASFNRLGFPTATRGNERWKYTNVAPIANATFEYPFEVGAEGASAQQIRQVAPWDETWARLVFVDGHYVAALSTPQLAESGMRAGNLADVMQEDGHLADEHLGRLATVEDDGFTAINTAFIRDGAFVHVPDGSLVACPLHLLFVATGRSRPTVSYPRTLIVAGRHSKLTVVESYVALSEAEYFTNAVTEMVANEGAQIEHYRYLRESPRAFHVGTTRVRVGRDSTFTSTSFARGARLARNDLQVLLDAPGSSCLLKGLHFTSGTQHIDNHISIDHAKPHASSEQYFKGILNDRSRAVFTGRVLVRKDAQKTVAHQADKNLLLSQGARINARPSLEIFADDVQCSHGATTGALAEDALFYMRSRGLDSETARKLLILGFASEIIEAVRLKPLRDHMAGLFSGDLPELETAIPS